MRRPTPLPDRPTLSAAMLFALALAAPAPALAAPKDECAKGLGMYTQVRGDPNAYDPDQGISRDAIKLQLNQCGKYLREIKLKNLPPSAVAIEEPQLTYGELQEFVLSAEPDKVLNAAHAQWLSTAQEKRSAGKRAKLDQKAAVKGIHEERCANAVRLMKEAQAAIQRGELEKAPEWTAIADDIGTCNGLIYKRRQMGDDAVAIEEPKMILGELREFLKVAKADLKALRERQEGAAREQKEAEGKEAWAAHQEELKRSGEASKKEFAEKAKASQAKRAKEDEEWAGENVKGSDMRKVWEQHDKGRPYTKASGSNTVWTFRSHTSGAVWHECEDYVFTGSGKLKDQKKYRCE